MHINPVIAINDLHNYLVKEDYTLSESVLNTFIMMEEICYNNDFNILEWHLLLPLIKCSSYFINVINLLGGNADLTVNIIMDFYKDRDDPLDSYQSDQRLYSKDDEELPNIRKLFIDESIHNAITRKHKIIDEFDLILGFLNVIDILTPLFNNGLYYEKKLQTPYNTLSHILGDYHKDLFIKFDDIRGEIDKMITTTYDIAISFAGEDREIAKKISDLLKQKNYKVFYDEYEKSNLWGKDLYSYLSEVYSSKAKFCLMIISKNYANKTWTNHERKAAQAKAFNENSEYILPLRLDDTSIPGLLGTIGYIDYNNSSIEEIVDLLIKKLNIK
jgi:hypothetical protein